MPQPVSVTLKQTNRPAGRRDGGGRNLRQSAALCGDEQVTALGMASRALTARFMMTCSIMPDLLPDWPGPERSAPPSSRPHPGGDAASWS